MKQQHILITGANRGIGLALVREYIKQRGAKVTATCRNPDGAHDLQALAREYPEHLFIEELEIDDDDSIAAAVDSVKKRDAALDLLLFNAGTNAKGDSRAYGIGGLKRSAFRGIIETNAVSQIIAAQAFLPLLSPGAQDTVDQPAGHSPAIVFVSSQMGSLELAIAGRVNAYSVSKAALNMVAVGLARELRERGITVLTMHPGHVATDMGGAGAPVKPADSAKGIADVVASSTLEQSGYFLDWQGTRLPW